MGAVILRLLRLLPVALKYAVQIGPLIYEGSVWVIKIIREWRKKPEKKDPSVEPTEGVFVDSKPDPG